MIHVIGMGVDGRESLGARALGVISRAGLLLGGRRHLDEFPDFSGKTYELKGGLPAAASAIEKFLKGKGRGVAVLATGDPLFFGIASFVIKRFGKKNVEVVPNVSAVQEAFARVKESWAGAKVVSAHGRGADLSKLCVEAASCARLAVFTDPVNTPARIAKALMDAGLTGGRAYVCEALGTGQERVTGGSLGKIAVRKRFHPLNIMLLINDAAPIPAPRASGIPDEEFVHSGGMITKQEIRAVALSKLAVLPGSVVWDIGAGCGSVAVEAALLAWPGRVIAVEKLRGRAKEIRANKKKFHAANLDVIEGAAPGAMTGRKLPAPDAVFAGGGGEGLAAILRYASRRLKRGGRLVVNAVTLESAHTAFGFFGRQGWERELAVVSVSKAKGIGGLNLLKAANPVFIVKGVKP